MPSTQKETKKRIRTTSLKSLRQKKHAISSGLSNEEPYLACQRTFSTTFHEDMSGLTSFLKLLENMADIYRSLSLYKCKEVVQLVSELPECQFNTGWVIIVLAKSHIELHNFREVSPILKKKLQRTN